MFAAAAAAFTAVFIAEFGDKSQLVSLTMACRYPPLHVLAGAMAAFTVLIGLAVVVGGVIAFTVPHTVVALVSGLVFVVFGVSGYIRPYEPHKSTDGKAGFLQSMVMIFVAELGDKTQVATVLLAAGSGYPLAVFVGAMAAMLLNHLLAVFLGSRLINLVDPRLVKNIGALLFIVFGLIMIVMGFV